MGLRDGPHRPGSHSLSLHSHAKQKKRRGSSTEIAAGDVVGDHEAFQRRQHRLVGSAGPRRGKLHPASAAHLSIAGVNSPSSVAPRKTLTLRRFPNPQDIRKALGNMKSLAVEYERDGKSDKARARERSPILIPI